MVPCSHCYALQPAQCGRPKKNIFDVSARPQFRRIVCIATGRAFMDDTLAAARRWYAEDLRYKVPVLRNPKLIEAFATIRREQFVGPGPWSIISDPYSDPFLTPDDDPRWLRSRDDRCES
ncbi:hypothetical protein ACVWW4_000311 [Bradyrhizobium sp. LB7.1]